MFEQLRLIFWSGLLTAHIFTAECQSVSGMQHRPAMMLMQRDGDWLLNCCLCIHHSPKCRIRAECYFLYFCLEVKMFTLTGFEKPKSLHVGSVLKTHLSHLQSLHLWMLIPHSDPFFLLALHLWALWMGLQGSNHCRRIIVVWKSSAEAESFV